VSDKHQASFNTGRLLNGQKGTLYCSWYSFAGDAHARWLYAGGSRKLGYQLSAVNNIISCSTGHYFNSSTFIH
jgi:hypothetical protein